MKEEMTVDDAEDIYMAWQVGKPVEKSEIARALLILKKQELELRAANKTAEEK